MQRADDKQFQLLCLEYHKIYTYTGVLDTKYSHTEAWDESVMLRRCNRPFAITIYKEREKIYIQAQKINCWTRAN